MKKNKQPKIGDWVTIEHKGKDVPAHVVDIHKDGRITVAWSEQIRVKGKQEDLKLRVNE